MKRLRGLKSLIQDAVDKSSRAIERAQLDTAKMPFDVVERMPGIKVPASGVRKIYNAGVSNVHGMIRLVNQVTFETIDAVLDAVESREGSAEKAPDAAGSPERKAS